MTRGIAAAIVGGCLAATSALAAPTSTLSNPPIVSVMLPNGQLSPGQTGQAAPFDGLGDASQGMPGIALVGPWHSDGSVRVFLFTGDAPEPYGTFTLTFPRPVVAPGLRPICTLSAMWANPDYAGGYANPLWPPVFFQQHEYVLTGLKVTQSFVYQVQGWLQPRAAYEVNIQCTPKQL